LAYSRRQRSFWAIVLMDLAKVVSMSEWRELTWDDAMQRGYEALSSGEALFEEIDAEQGRSNIDIEKHLRRAELRLAQAHAWLAMARELAWQRDDYGGRAAR
jgi:predicted transcriptional regulator